VGHEFTGVIQQRGEQVRCQSRCTQHSTARHSTTQHGTAQHSTAQHRHLAASHCQHPSATQQQRACADGWLRVACCCAQVTGLQVGDRVMSPFTTSCGACFYCTKGACGFAQQAWHLQLAACVLRVCRANHAAAPNMLRVQAPRAAAATHRVRPVSAGCRSRRNSLTGWRQQPARAWACRAARRSLCACRLQRERS
jgi:hypothetical protein